MLCFCRKSFQIVTLSDGDITVTVDKVSLVMGEDFEIVGYSNNIKKGTALVTIKGIGLYGGTKTYKFTIKPQGLKWF